MDTIYGIFTSTFLLSKSEERPHGFLSEAEFRSTQKADSANLHLSSFLHLTGVWMFLFFVPLGFYVSCIQHAVITSALAIVALALCLPFFVFSTYMVRLIYVYAQFCYHLSYTQSAWVQLDKLHDSWLQECFKWEHENPEKATMPGFLYCREKRMIMFRRLASFILRYHNFLSDKNSTIDGEVHQLGSLMNLAASIPDQFLALSNLNNMMILMHTMRSKTILTVNLQHQSKMSERMESSLFSWDTLRYCEDVGKGLARTHVITANSFQLKMEVQLERESEATFKESSRILDNKPESLEMAKKQYKYLAERLVSIDSIHRDDPESAYVYLELLDNSESPRDDVFSAIYSILMEVKRAMDSLEQQLQNQRNFNMSG